MYCDESDPLTRESPSLLPLSYFVTVKFFMVVYEDQIRCIVSGPISLLLPLMNKKFNVNRLQLGGDEVPFL